MKNARATLHPFLLCPILLLGAACGGRDASPDNGETDSTREAYAADGDAGSSPTSSSSSSGGSSPTSSSSSSGGSSPTSSSSSSGGSPASSSSSSGGSPASSSSSSGGT